MQNHIPNSIKMVNEDVGTKGGDDEEEEVVDTVIVGGGVSGVVCFEALCAALPSHRTVLLEARQRFGGRTCTEAVDLPARAGAMVDTGGQWLAACHTKMLSICQSLGLEVEEQVFPGADAGAGGEGAGAEGEGGPCGADGVKNTAPLTKQKSLIEMAYYSLRELDDEAKAEVASFEDFLAAAYRRLACNGVSAEEKAFWDQSSARYSIYLHFWYKTTNTDAKSAARDIIVARCSKAAAVEELSYFIQV